MTKQQKIFNFIVDLAQKGFGLGWNESVYLADHILTYQDKMGVVIKVDRSCLHTNSRMLNWLMLAGFYMRLTKNLGSLLLLGNTGQITFADMLMLKMICSMLAMEHLNH